MKGLRNSKPKRNWRADVGSGWASVPCRKKRPIAQSANGNLMIETSHLDVSKSLNTTVALPPQPRVKDNFPDARLVLETFSSGQAVVIKKTHADYLEGFSVHLRRKSRFNVGRCQWASNELTRVRLKSSRTGDAHRHAMCAQARGHLVQRKKTRFRIDWTCTRRRDRHVS